MIHILQTVVTYVVMLGVLVVVHEWGHFIVARTFKIRVDEFSIGFGPRAIRIGKRGDTEYNVRWIPLGGYVKIAGMEADEEPLLIATDKAKQLLSKDEETVLSKAPLLAENMPNVDETQSQKDRDAIDGFYTKPLWQRSLVIFAGPVMSFVLGYVLLCSIGLIGAPFEDNEVAAVEPHSVAQQIGLRPHDRIIKINNVDTTDFPTMVDIIHHGANKVLTLTVERNGKSIIIRGTPKVQPGAGNDDQPIFGFAPGQELQRTSLRESIAMGNDMTEQVFIRLGTLVKDHKLSEIRSHAGGPIYIAQVTSQAVKQGLPDTISLAAQLSISLAIFNLFPIPILDGGHLLLFFVESIRRGRRLTLEQQQNFMLAGLAIIGVLFICIMINDVTRHISP